MSETEQASNEPTCVFCCEPFRDGDIHHPLGCTIRTEDRAHTAALLRHQQDRLDDLVEMLERNGDHEAAVIVHDAAGALRTALEQVEGLR